MAELIPGILTDDPDELKGLLSEASAVGDRVHIDIIDGEFADNTTIDPSVLTTLDTGLKIDFHLMTEEPADWIEKCANALGDRVFGQVEVMTDQIEFLEKAKEWGMAGGVALDFETEVGALDSRVFDIADGILLMSVQAGFGGQEFEESVIDKIKKLKGVKLRTGSDFNIAVDGGITPRILKNLVKAGVDEAIVGQRIFEGDSKKNIEEYKEALKG